MAACFLCLRVYVNYLTSFVLCSWRRGQKGLLALKQKTLNLIATMKGVYGYYEKYQKKTKPFARSRKTFLSVQYAFFSRQEKKK